MTAAHAFEHLRKDDRINDLPASHLVPDVPAFPVQRPAPDDMAAILPALPTLAQS